MFASGFPKELAQDVNIELGVLPTKTFNNCACFTDYGEEYCTASGRIFFPYRVYYVDISDGAMKNLSKTQRMIIHSIYTRSCDGYLREKHLRQLLETNYDDWAIPYIVKLCDEYVLAILNVVYKHFQGKDPGKLKSFWAENPATFRKSYSRMISYWNVYYRYRETEILGIDNYVGQKIFTECFGYDKPDAHIK